MEDLEPRDLLAMFALTGLLIRDQDSFIEDTAICAYDIADAMIEARKPAPTGLPPIKRRVKK